MRKKYRVIREDRAPKGFRVQVGETVYEPSVADYGIARLDSQSTGIEYISVTRDSDGKYPTFTIPLEDLAELHTAGVVVEIQEHRQPVERLMFRGNRFYGPVRHITAHKVDDFNRRLEVVAVDNPDIDQANDRYQICWLGQDENDPSCLTIHFQNGALLEAGVNGVSNEALIAVVMDRLQGFQKGPYQCTQNDRAIQRLQEALFWLQNRSDERARRGVEGTSRV